MNGDDLNPRVFARGIPSVVKRIDEAAELGEFIAQSVVIFAAALVLMALAYLALNTAAAQLRWLWEVLVRAALIAPALLVGLLVVRWFTDDIYAVRRADGLHVRMVEAGDRRQHIYITVVTFCVFWFLAGGKFAVVPELPFGEVARYLIGALDFPEGADLGTALLSLWQALTASMLIAGMVALTPLIGRLRAELRDVHDSAIELAREKMRIDWERERWYLEHGDIVDVDVQPRQFARPVPIRIGAGGRPRGRADGPSEAADEDVPVAVPRQPFAGVTGYSRHAKKDVNVPVEIAQYFIHTAAAGRSLARSQWAGDEQISRVHWEALTHVMTQGGWVGHDKKLNTPPQEIMRRLGILPDDEPATDNATEEQEEQDVA